MSAEGTTRQNPRTWHIGLAAAGVINAGLYWEAFANVPGESIPGTANAFWFGVLVAASPRKRKRPDVSCRVELTLPKALDGNGPRVVTGGPVNETAMIMRIDGRWKYLRGSEHDSSGWTGAFDTPADALAALKADFLGL